MSLRSCQRIDRPVCITTPNTSEVVKIFRSRFDTILALSTEGCIVCGTCVYTNQPWRFPERMFPAIEGFGINMMQLAKTGGLKHRQIIFLLTRFIKWFLMH
ncbi:MAG: DUF2284 domain-containing protein [Acidobacteriota bacterium]|nr:DUF2284 domain-containing protein [Acidobacteriota bacterium]